MPWVKVGLASTLLSPLQGAARAVQARYGQALMVTYLMSGSLERGFLARGLPMQPGYHPWVWSGEQSRGQLWGHKHPGHGKGTAGDGTGDKHLPWLLPPGPWHWITSDEPIWGCESELCGMPCFKTTLFHVKLIQLTSDLPTNSVPFNCLQILSKLILENAIQVVFWGSPAVYRDCMASYMLATTSWDKSLLMRHLRS